MSADQALTRAQSRRIAKIDAAIDAGREARLQKNMNVTLKLLTNGSVKLVHADGTVTPEGTHYYGKLEVTPPTIFPYEQPLDRKQVGESLWRHEEAGSAHDHRWISPYQVGS